MRGRLEHLRYRRYLDAYVDQELEGDLSARVGRHVRSCEMCAAAARTTQVVKHRLSLRRFLPSRPARSARNQGTRRTGG